MSVPSKSELQFRHRQQQLVQKQYLPRSRLPAHEFEFVHR
jgi:hypothetical protein